ncbi:hypothetical protein [Mycobacterium sp. AZCC_0083]|nr:hypothetical protein [Mycobacterium sp. AZCC_0083]MBB5166671.1 hypothetical protein [Mycobacterium sp. AZCC_0083]
MLFGKPSGAAGATAVSARLALAVHLCAATPSAVSAATAVIV